VISLGKREEVLVVCHGGKKEESAREEGSLELAVWEGAGVMGR